MNWFVNSIWENYRQHQNLQMLKDDILSDPWYQPPTVAEQSLLMRAVECADPAAVQFLLSMGDPPNLPPSLGFSLLHQAVDEASSDRSPGEIEQALTVLKILLVAGADPNVYGCDGTPLHRAAGEGNIEAAKLLLAHGANLEARMLVDGELTPLMFAAVMGCPEMVKFLLDVGANRTAMSGCSLTLPPMTLRDLITERNPQHMKEILGILDI